MDKLKQAEQIAIDTKVKMDEALAKKETESKGAGKEEKTEGETILAKAEKQAAEDSRILSSKEEELSDADKARKVEIQKAKEEKEGEKKEETVDDKIKRTKEETQKRIDEVIGELKAERADRQQDKEKIAELEAELGTLKKPKAEEDKTLKVQQLFQEQIAQYLEEDKEKPREDRREMTKDELEEWLLEDYVSAAEWLTDRNIRRKEEKGQIKSLLEEIPKKEAAEFIKKQNESMSKLVAKYPSLVPSPEMKESLKGKTKEEADAILSENEDYRIMMEIINKDRQKYIESVNGPELVLEEMDKIKNRGKKTVTLTEEELQQRIKEAAVVEAQRIAGLDEGLTSGGIKKVERQENKTPFRIRQEEIARKANIPMDKLDAALKRRESIPGANFATAEEFKKE